MTEINKNVPISTETRLKLNTLNSNSRNSLGLNLSNRKDVYGNVISKKKKTHRICFADESPSSKELVEIKIVKSYRSENNINNVSDWSCIIF